MFGRKKQETVKLVVKAVLSGFRAIDTGVSMRHIDHLRSTYPLFQLLN
jgi:hypothetical protein